MKIPRERMILLSGNAKQRLLNLLQSVRRFMRPEPAHLRDLQEALDEAMVVAPAEMPPDVVTVNSTVKLTDLESQSQKVYMLVFPCDANLSDSKISVLAPLGAALLGYRPGDVVHSTMPGGARRLRIEEVTPGPAEKQVA